MAALRLLLVASLLALPLWVAHSVPAHACTPSVVTMEEAVEAADLIVIGTIGEMLVLPPESVEDPETLTDGRTPVEIKFAVSEYLKGSGSGTLLIYQPAAEISYDAGAISSILSSLTTCGSVTNAGDRFVMFMKKIDPFRYSSGGLVETRGAAEDERFATYVAQIRAALQRQPVLPPTGSGPPHHSAPIVPLVAASALAGLALAANAAFALRRRD